MNEKQYHNLRFWLGFLIGTQFIVVATLVWLLVTVTSAPAPSPVVVTVIAPTQAPVVVEPTVAPPTEEVPTPTVEKTNQDYQEGKPFRTIFDAQSHPVHRLFIQGFLDACADLDLLCEPILMDTVTLDEYVSKMEGSVSLGSSGVTMSLGIPVLYEPGALLAENFPTISAHSVVPQGDIPGLLGWVAADPAQYSPEAARAMAEKIECQGPVAITQNSQSNVENGVADYFREELAFQCPGIEILETQMEGAEPSHAAEVDAAILAAHPDLTGAYSTTGGGPTSWATALKEAGKEPGDVTVISMDYSAPNLALVEEGWVYALVGQPIYEEYYHAVELLLAATKGETIPYENLLEAKLIFKGETAPYIQINCRAGNLTGDACK